MENGDLLVLTEDPGYEVVEDMIVLIDRETGEIKKSWDLKDCLVPGEGASGGYTPKSPEEIKRYACKGKEVIEYIPAGTNAYQIAIENEVQGPLCFEAFEKVLGDYTIGRTYNIYPLSGTAYGMEKEIQVTMKIPSAIYKENREYKMICVTKDGKPILYGDLDSNPETITIKTNKFYAYALIYK